MKRGKKEKGEKGKGTEEERMTGQGEDKGWEERGEKGKKGGNVEG